MVLVMLFSTVVGPYCLLILATISIQSLTNTGIFQKVKDYIVEHGTATAEEISKEVGVSEGTILQYLRDGRIEIPENSPIFIKCEKCHCDIRYGRYCQECASKMKGELKKGTAAIDLYEVGEKPTIHTAARMHTYHKERERGMPVQKEPQEKKEKEK